MTPEDFQKFFPLVDNWIWAALAAHVSYDQALAPILPLLLSPAQDLLVQDVEREKYYLANLPAKTDLRTLATTIKRYLQYPFVTRHVGCVHRCPKNCTGVSGILL